MDDTLYLALETINLNKQALIFAPSRTSAEKTAEEISLSTAFFYPELAKKILKAVSSPTKQCHRLSSCVKKGVAFHHAGLTQKQKELIEEEFRQGTIRIICCTPTLAAGISTPAFRVILKSLKRYSSHWGMDWIPVLEYLQMAGRAGRPEFESYGEAISLAKTESEGKEIYEKYLCGQPEDIYSKLAVEPVLRTHILSLIATERAKTSEEIITFFSKTFWACQFKDINKIREIINRMLLLLEGFEFIKSSNKANTFVLANQLSSSYEATLIGKRVSELYLDPLTAHHLISCLKNSSFFSPSPFSFLQMISYTAEIYPLLKVKVKDEEEIEEKHLQKSGQLLMPEPAHDFEYDDFLASIKTALFFESWIEESEEDYLLDKYDIRPGEIHHKIELADWLLYSTAELAKLLKHYSLLPEISQLRVRVKKGIKKELLPLIRLKGIGRKRARKLFNQGFTDFGKLKKAELPVLVRLLGEALALEVKKQLGEELGEREKRQEALTDY